MRIINDAAFASTRFDSQDVDGNDFCTFVLKCMFEIIQGKGLKPAQAHQPLVMANEYRSDDLFRSVVRRESDTFPLKPNGDSMRVAVAFASGGEPTESWIASAKIGRIAKSIRVTGPRYWMSSPLRGWYLTRPNPATSVPLICEFAYGGKYFENAETESYPFNLAWVGFYDRKSLRTTNSYPAPQFESLEDPIPFFAYKLPA